MTAAGRRVTPHGVLVLTADAGPNTARRREWLAHRERSVGSSDIAPILGVPGPRTALEVWEAKQGNVVEEWPDRQRELMDWGNLLEEPIARYWTMRNRSVIERVGTVAHQDVPWMTCTLDRRVLECPLDPNAVRRKCALEIKNKDVHVRGKWRAEVPDDILAQVTWQMIVTGYDHIHVGVLFGGNTFKQSVVRWDDDLASFVLATVTAWYERHLIGGVRPSVEHDIQAGKADALVELDALLHGTDRAGELSVAEIGLVIEYAELARAKADAEKAVKVAKARLVELAQGHRYVTFADELAYEVAPREREDIDRDRLAEQFPQAYAACRKITKFNALAIAKEYKQR